MNVLYLKILVSYRLTLSKKFYKVPGRIGGKIEHRARDPPVFCDFLKFCGIVRYSILNNSLNTHDIFVFFMSDYREMYTLKRYILRYKTSIAGMEPRTAAQLHPHFLAFFRTFAPILGSLIPYNSTNFHDISNYFISDCRLLYILNIYVKKFDTYTVQSEPDNAAQVYPLFLRFFTSISGIVRYLNAYNFLNFQDIFMLFISGCRKIFLRQKNVKTYYLYIPQQAPRTAAQLHPHFWRFFEIFAVLCGIQFLITPLILMISLCFLCQIIKKCIF